MLIVKVLRNGKIIDINVYSLLVGDIMQVNTGENFPVDGLLLKGFSNIISFFYSIFKIWLLMNPQSRVKVILFINMHWMHMEKNLPHS